MNWKPPRSVCNNIFETYHCLENKMYLYPSLVLPFVPFAAFLAVFDVLLFFFKFEVVFFFLLGLSVTVGVDLSLSFLLLSGIGGLSSSSSDMSTGNSSGNSSSSFLASIT